MRRITITTLAAMALVTPLAACGSGAPEETSATPAPPKELTTGELIAQARPALGKVFVETALGQRVSGTLVVTDAVKGEAITSGHVVEGAETIAVKFPGQPGRISAKVVGMKLCPDLALLKLSRMPDGVKALPFANSDDGNVGDRVVSMGFSESARRWNQATARATTGIISDVGIRNADMGPAIGTLDTDFTMSDAAFGPGSSGGPLLTRFGEVAGIITAGNEGADGQGYAIASNVVKETLPALAAGSKGTGLEMTPVQTLDMRTVLYGLYASEGLTRHGASVLGGLAQKMGGMLVLSARPGSPADRRGFKLLDVVLRQNNLRANDQNKTCRILGSSDVVKMTGYSLGEWGSLFDEFTRRVAVK